MNRRILDFLRRPGARFFEPVEGGSASWTFSQAESAAMLPDTAIWISQEGITLDVGVSAWSSSYGGISATVSQADGAKQPAYSATGGVGGRPLIMFDGVDDSLFTSVFTLGTTSWSNFEGGMAGAMLSGNSNGDKVLEYYQPTGRYRPLQRASTGSRVNANIQGGVGGSTTWGTDVDGVTGHFSGDWDGADLTVRLAGVAQSTVATAGVSLLDGGKFTICAFNAGTSAWAAAEFQSAYIGAKLTDEQRTYLRALLTYYTGVNC